MRALRFVVLVVVLALLSGYAVADDARTAPRLVKFSGTVANAQGATGVTFAIYAAQTGGAPLWIETQNVTVDEKGRFTIYLGANHADGLPVDLFSSGEARWLGIQTEGQPEQPRVLLVAVPYALHSANADMLGGLPASAYVLAPSTVTSGGNYVNSATVAQAAYAISGAVANAVPKFSNAAGDMTSSAIYEANGNLGIGTSSPARSLHIKSASPNIRIEDTHFANSFWELQQSAYMDDWFGFLRYDTSLGSFQAVPAKSLIISNEGKFGFGISDVYNKMSERVNIGAGNLKLWGASGTDGIIFPDGTKQTTAYTGQTGATYTAGAGLMLNVNEFSVADAGISTAKIADAAITDAKLAAGISAAKITGSINADMVDNKHAADFAPIVHNHDASYVSLAGAYVNPAWLTSIDASKLTGGVNKTQLPSATVYADQANTFTTDQVIGNAANFMLNPAGYSDATSGKSSGMLGFTARSYRPGMGTRDFTFYWDAEPINNNTDNANAILRLSQYYYGTIYPRDLWINGDGTVHFPANQMFPGALSSIIAGTGLTGGTINNAGTIALNTDFTDARYAAKAGGNSLNGDQNITGNGTYTGTVTAAKFVGDGSGLTNLNVSDLQAIIARVTALENAVSTLTPRGFPKYAARFGGTGNDMAYGVAVDGSGNVVMVGSISTTVDFGCGPLTSAGNYDIFVTKFSPDGSCQWSKRFGDSGADSAMTVAVDGLGSIYVGGYYNSTTIDFGNGSRANAGGNDMYVLKLTANGELSWVKTYGGTGDENVNAIAIDHAGNVLLAGYFTSPTIDLGAGATANAGSGTFDGFLLKLTNAGAYVWAKTFGGSSADNGNAVAVDSSDNILLAGTFSGSLDFGGGALTNAGGTDIFIVKYTAAGDHVWSKAFGGSGYDYVRGVALDASDNIFLGGYYASPSIDFGGGALSNAGAPMNDLYLAKFSSTGSHLWSKRFGDSSSQSATGIAVDSEGSVSISAYGVSSVDFGGGALSSAGGSDMFVAKFAGDGTYIWSSSFGGPNTDTAGAIASDPGGDVWVTGYFQGSAMFGKATLTSAGQNDIPLLRLKK